MSKHPRYIEKCEIYRTLLNLTCENHDHMDQKTLHALIAVHTGHSRHPKRPLNEMSNEEFFTFLNKAMDFIAVVIIPGLDKRALARELHAMLECH